MKTAAEKRHHNRLAQMGCLLCEELSMPQASRTEIHHIRAGQGMGQRAGHYLAVPLCADCHRGPTGIHGDQTLLRIAKLTEMDLLDMTIGRLK